MKKFIIIAAALSTLAMAASASAAPWQNINARQERLDNRIDQGVRTGRLTRAEAVQSSAPTSVSSPIWKRAIGAATGST